MKAVIISFFGWWGDPVSKMQGPDFTSPGPERLDMEVHICKLVLLQWVGSRKGRHSKWNFLPMEASHIYPGPLLLAVFTSLCMLWNLLQSWNLSLLTYMLKNNSNQIWQPCKHPQSDQEGQGRDTREEPCWSVVPWLLCSRFHLSVLQIETQIIQGLRIDNLIEVYSQKYWNW